MSQLKAYLFWIVCGVLAVAIIAASFLASPMEEAVAVKRSLDNQQKQLMDLDARARRGDPVGEFDAQDPADIAKLTNDYIITENWRRVLEPHQAKYAAQQKAIKDHLVARSNGLHRPVAVTTSIQEWYEEYIRVSEPVIARLRQAGAIPAPVAAAAAPGVAAPVVAGEGSPAEVRTAVGLYTRGSVFPDVAQHALLTTRLRIVEHLTDAILRVRVPVAVNPVVGATSARPAEETFPMLTGITWRDGNEDPLGGEVAALADPISCVVNLRGSVAALLAAEVELERNEQADRPVVVVLGGTLQRKPAFDSGERLEVAHEQAVLRLELLVLDFTKAGKEPVVEAPPVAAPPAEAPIPKRNKKQQTTGEEEQP